MEYLKPVPPVPPVPPPRIIKEETIFQLLKNIFKMKKDKFNINDLKPVCPTRPKSKVYQTLFYLLEQCEVASNNDKQVEEDLLKAMENAIKRYRDSIDIKR